MIETFTCWETGCPRAGEHTDSGAPPGKGGPGLRTLLPRLFRGRWSFPLVVGTHRVGGSLPHFLRAEGQWARRVPRPPFSWESDDLYWGPDSVSLRLCHASHPMVTLWLGTLEMVPQRLVGWFASWRSLSSRELLGSWCLCGGFMEISSARCCSCRERGSGFPGFHQTHSSSGAVSSVPCVELNPMGVVDITIISFQNKCPLTMCVSWCNFILSYVMFLNPHPRTCSLVLETRRGEKESKPHRCERETGLGCLLYVPQPGVEPAT